MKREVIKYTLQSYLGSYVNTSKGEALNKMKGLPADNFDELVKDIVNEIHRRTNLEYDYSDRPMRKKLTKLKEEKFKNLVSDVLEVFNFRYPQYAENIDDDINKISKLITFLKTEDDITEQIINETNFNLKYKIFIEYIKNKYVDEDDKIVDYMIEYTNKNMEYEFDDSLNALFNYKFFIENIDKSKYAGLKKYNFFKENISRIENMNIESDIRKDLISSEFHNMLKLIIDNQYFYEKDIIKNNISNLIDIIQKIDYLPKSQYIKNQKEKSAISFAQDVNVEETSVNQEDTINIKNTIENIIMNCAKMDYISSLYIEKLSKLITKTKLYSPDILSIISNIRNILENIKKNNL
ncbi:hypothetical protein P3W45_000742 [Vairimorpha bombi]|jgi:hypothetical protein